MDNMPEEACRDYLDIAIREVYGPEGSGDTHEVMPGSDEDRIVAFLCNLLGIILNWSYLAVCDIPINGHDMCTLQYSH